MLDQIAIPTSRRYGTLSPLRYPGGKASLAGLFADLIAKLGMCGVTYVEPYAGGAGAGIALLREGVIERLVINDFDRAVYAFWHSVVHRNDDFVNLVQSAELSVGEWKRQRAIYVEGDTDDLLGLGFAFFYLNRTNRSGVLRAGVIGGNAQNGNYLIDARYNPSTLAERITALGGVVDQITVMRKDGRTVIREYEADRNAFLYVDPPYVSAGARLYMNAFVAQDHEALSRVMTEVSKAAWLMTYDVSPLIEELYKDHFQRSYSLNYSSHHPGQATEMLIASPAVADALLRVMGEA